MLSTRYWINHVPTSAPMSFVRHDTKEKALQEAKRLTTIINVKGQKVFTLETVVVTEARTTVSVKKLLPLKEKPNVVKKSVPKRKKPNED